MIVHTLILLGVLAVGFVLLLACVALSTTPKPRPITIGSDNSPRANRRTRSSQERVWLGDPYGD